MLSKFEYDGDLNPSFRRGPFRLPFNYISTYLPTNVPPRFVHVSSAGECGCISRLGCGVLWG